MKIAPRLLSVLALTFLVGCGPLVRVALVGTPEVDSVLGKLELEKAEGDLLLLMAVLRELPSPDKVDEDATRYVAWLFDEEGSPRVFGELERNPLTREGRVSGTLRDRSFVFQVTAEGDEPSEAPSRHVVVSRRVSTDTE